jgi:DNA-binding PucR family transcriptional regulator
VRWPEGGAYAVAVSDDEDVGERLRHRRGDILWSGRVILARDPLQLVPSLVSAGAGGGVSAPFARLADAPEALRQAEIAALCTGVGFGPVAAYDRLGSWALIATLWDRAGRPAPPATILALAHHRRGGQLIEALEGLLEHGGDVAEAARGLSMHRATLYRRLKRVEEITGLDLEAGDDRLLAHLGLRLYRLNATTVAPAPA